MKRIENLVIGGIESKMLALVLISMLLVAAVFVVSMLTQNTMLTKLTQATSERQLASMTGTTTAVIDTVIVENLDRITDLEAAVTDQLFRDQAVGVRPVSEYAGKLLSNPDSVPPRALAEARRFPRRGAVRHGAHDSGAECRAGRRADGRAEKHARRGGQLREERGAV